MRILLIISFLVLASCASRLVKYNSNKDCETVFVGQVQSTYNYKSNEASLYPKSHSKGIFGDIIEVKNNGIIFDQKDEGLYRPEAKLYVYDEIYCAINDSGKIVYGFPPNTMCEVLRAEITLIKLDEEKEKKYKFETKTNEQFSYCIEPGRYKFHNIIFYNKDISIEHFEKLPQIEFEIKENKINDIGNIKIDISRFPEEDSHIINASKIELPPNFILGGLPLIFNVVSVAVQTAIHTSKVSGVHTIKFEEEFYKSSYKQTEYVPIRTQFEPTNYEKELLKIK